MKALIFQVMMLVCVPAEDVPELLRVSIEQHCSYEQALEIIIENRVMLPGFYCADEILEK